jgi:hypothetical protein
MAQTPLVASFVRYLINDMHKKPSNLRTRYSYFRGILTHAYLDIFVNKSFDYKRLHNSDNKNCVLYSKKLQRVERCFPLTSRINEDFIEEYSSVSRYLSSAFVHLHGDSPFSNLLLHDLRTFQSSFLYRN